MKIGGITWWRNNYGSILQAYALQRYLIDVEKIDYTIINQYSEKMASLDNLLDKLKNEGLIRTTKRLVFRFGLHRLRNRVRVLQNFVDDNLKVSDRVYNKNTIRDSNHEFDGFICGSDQIWNPNNTELDSIYWLKFVEPGKLKIAYAPSIGVNSVTPEQSNVIRDNLASFNAISSREEAGSRLINSILQSEACITVLDPTMLINREIWDQISTARSGNYIFVYLLKGTVEDRRRIERFSRMVKMPIITLPFLDNEYVVPYDFIFGNERVWDADPIDFIGLIRGATYIFTDSFHCIVFSCLYHKNYFVFPKKGKMQMSRINGLQDLLMIDNRLISSSDTSEDLVRKTLPDWDLVDRIISEKRIESKQYLHKSLKKGYE